MSKTNECNTAKPPMTPSEVGNLVWLYRRKFGWSQITLAEIAKITPRTVQRVEAGEPSSLDTKRAIARAFNLSDLDMFSRPNPFLTKDELEEQKAKFDREYIVLDAKVIDGRGVASMFSRGHG